MSSRLPMPPPSGRRPERSCAVCHRRKVRCDKKLPCSPCSRGGYSCTYPPAGQPVRRARKTTIKDVASRISELEKTLSTVTQDNDMPFKTASRTVTPALSEPTCPSQPPEESRPGTSPSDEVLLTRGTSSQYFNEVLLSRMIEQEKEVRTALATPRSESSQSFGPSPFNPMGILSAQSFSTPLTSYLPSKSEALQLWRVYSDYMDPCAKVLHIPTDQLIVFTVMDDPSKASDEDLALCFAVYFAAVIALDPRDAPGILAEGTTASLQRYKTGLDQALAHADILENPTITLLKALAVYLPALRVHNSGRAIWTLNGLAIRAAQSIGLHRDGKKLGLSPFESEIRRRLWWHFLGRDGRAAEDYGLQSPTSHRSEVDEPLNLHDEDLYPEMKELPPPREGWTRMTLALMNTEIARAWSLFSQMSRSSAGAPGEEFRARIVRDFHNRVENLLKHCNPVVPQQRMTIRVARFVCHKVDLVTRQQYQTFNHMNESSLATGEENLLEGLNLLEEMDLMWSDELLQPFVWSIRSYPQYHLILFMLWSICVRPDGTNARRALAAVEHHLETYKVRGRGPIQGSTWQILTALKGKAASLIERAGRVAVDGAATPCPQQMPQGAETSLESDMTGEPTADEPLSDWTSLLQDFKFDVTDFSMMF